MIENEQYPQTESPQQLLSLSMLYSNWIDEEPKTEQAKVLNNIFIVGKFKDSKETTLEDLEVESINLSIDQPIL